MTEALERPNSANTRSSTAATEATAAETLITREGKNDGNPASFSKEKKATTPSKSWAGCDRVFSSPCMMTEEMIWGSYTPFGVPVGAASDPPAQQTQEEELGNDKILRKQQDPKD